LKANDPARAILQFRNAVQATPRSAEAYYQLSLAYFAAHDIRMSVTSLGKALELNPNHAASRLRMAQLKTMASDPALVKEGREALAAILKENPNDIDAIHSIGFADLKLRQPEDAIQHLSQAILIAPADLVAAVSIAQAKLQQNDVAEAESVLRKASDAAPKSADAAVAIGQLYAGSARWEEADREFRRAVSLDPKSGWALFNLAALQNRKGQKQEAEELFRRLSAFPDKRYSTTYAAFLFQEGRQTEAVHELEKIYRAGPEDRGLRTRLVAAYRATNAIADAQKLLNAVLKQNPKDSEALLQKAELLMDAQKYEEAATDLAQVLRLQPDWAEAQYFSAKLYQARGENGVYREQLLKALQLNPLLVPLRVEAAQSLLAAKDPNGALALLDKTPDYEKNEMSIVVERNWVYWSLGDMSSMRKGINAAMAGGGTAEVLLQDGLWNLRQGKYGLARASLERALNLDPKDLRALKALTESYQKDKDNATAIQQVKQFAAREPNSAPVQDFLGVMLAVSGDRAGARAALDKAKAVDPKYIKADLALTQIDLVEGRFDDARQRVQTIVSADPSNPTAHLWLGNLQYMKGDRKAALDQYHQVVNLDPNNAAANNNYAYLLSEVDGNPTEALKYAQKAKELAPDDGDYSDTLGWILYRKGLYANAVSELQRAASGKDAIAKYHLAMAYARTGDVLRGQDALRAALKINASLPEAKMAQELLAAKGR
jgi:tetratricopeptide (TPR) repeat protein